MKKTLHEELRNMSLPEDDLSEIEKRLLEQVIDKEITARWSEALAQKGVRKQEAKRLSLRKLWLPVAAAIALLLVSWLVWHQWAPRDLYAQYREFPQASFATRSAQSPSPQDLAAIASAFNAGKYADALPLLDAYLAANPRFAEGQFYRALCHLELGHSQTAVDQLGELANGKSAFNEDANWFLALAYLQQKNYTACRQILQSFAPGSTYNTKSVQLLKEMKGF